jgi:hypothetical protein
VEYVDEKNMRRFLFSLADCVMDVLPNRISRINVLDIFHRNGGLVLARVVDPVTDQQIVGMITR